MTIPKASLPAATLPVGPAIPGWLQTLLFSLSPYDFIRKNNRQFGDVFTVQLAGMGNIIMFSTPQAVKEIFALSTHGLHNGNDVVRYLLHEKSVVFLENDAHQVARKTMTPPLNSTALQAYAPQFLKSAQAVTAAWSDGESINLYKAFQEITFEALLEAAIGESETAQNDKLRAALIDFVNGQLSNEMFFASVLFGSRLYDIVRKRTDANKQRLASGEDVLKWGLFAGRTANLAYAEQALEKIVKERRERGVAGTDILSRLLQAQHANETLVSDEFIVQQLLTILIAGHDTTALALSWAMSQVLQNPDILARIGAELDAVMGREFDLGQVHQLVYLQAVLQESLRITPGAAFVPRRLDHEVMIDGVLVPAGTTIAANIIGSHSRSATWKDPESFRPERFLEQDASSWTFLPFGGGLRRCLGAAFAMSEMQIVFAYLLHQWRFQGTSGNPRPSVHGFLIGPARALKAKVFKKPALHSTSTPGIFYSDSLRSP